MPSLDRQKLWPKLAKAAVHLGWFCFQAVWGEIRVLSSAGIAQSF